MKHQRIGVEVELDGLGLLEAQRLIRAYFGSETDHLGRKWSIERDSSVPRGFELVSPPIFYADIPTLQEAFRVLRQAGASRSRNTAIHVHIESRDWTVAQIASFVNVYASFASLIWRMVDVYSARRLLYARSIVPFARALSRSECNSMPDLKSLWYESWSDSVSATPTRYHESRYTELNLNSHFHRGTIEIRVFNSTNHAGKLRAFIVLALSLASFAKQADGRFPLSERRPTSLTSSLATCYEFLALLGLDQPQFASVRYHLIRNLRRSWLDASRKSRQSIEFAGRGMHFDGGSFLELMEEMIDGEFFANRDTWSAIADLRKGKGGGQYFGGGKYLGDERFARLVIGRVSSLPGCSLKTRAVTNDLG